MRRWVPYRKGEAYCIQLVHSGIVPNLLKTPLKTSNGIITILVMGATLSISRKRVAQKKPNPFPTKAAVITMVTK